MPYADEMDTRGRFNPDDPECPECGSGMYDNRAENAKHPGKRRPDFRCKRDREHVVWPPREKKEKGVARRDEPALAIHRDEAPAPAPAAPLTVEERNKALTRLMNMHTVITKHVLTQEAPHFLTAEVGDSPEAASARINSIFIAAKEAGLHR